MLIVVRSPAPALPLAAGARPAEAGELLALQHQPERCHWIVPDAARRRVIEANGAGLLPQLHSLEGFTRLLGLRAGAPPVIRSEERVVRLAQAWHDIAGSSAGPALLGQLDRFVCDWQLAALASPARPGDFFESLVRRYRRDLDSDGVHDEPEQLAALVRELSIEATPLPTSLSSARLVLFDGFVRLDALHLRLITELSRRIDVLVWLPTLAGGLAEEMLVALGRRRVPMRIIEHAPAAAPLAEVGARLFGSGAASAAVPGLFRVEADTPRGEVAQIARCIKAELRGAGSGLSPADVAIIVPNEAYAALAAEVLPRHGLDVDLSSLTTRVSQTRPARLLVSAWQVVRGPWRYEEVRDFLVQPMVRRQLAEPHLLDYLFEHRPRARQERTSATWLDAWQRLARIDAERVAAYERGERVLEARDEAERERRLAEQRERAAGVARLLDSIRRVLQPVIAMEAVLEGQASRPAALPELARACRALFDAVAMPDWLAHPETDVRDVQGHAHLDAALGFLSELPRDHMSFASLWQPDPLDMLRGVLDSLTISIDDGAGVCVRLLDRGASRPHRHVYVLGLQEGVQPAPPQGDAVLAARTRNATLRAQLSQQEAEAKAYFRGLFAAPTERLVLSGPVRGESDRIRPSPFMQAVEACAAVPRLDVPDDVTSVREAALLLGRAVSSRGAGEGIVAELWPKAVDDARLTDLAARLRAWRARDGWPRRNLVDAPLLLALRFPDDLAFSASDLETYAACPFRYFSLRVLKLQERDADQSRTHYGSLLHGVLQSFYDELRAEGSAAEGEPLPPITAADAPRLIELFEREWRRLGEGAIPPDVRTMFTVDQGVLQLFLDAMQKLEGEHGNLRNEFAIGSVSLGEDVRGRPVSISGRIDRIDRHRDTEHAIILDYKTGRGSRPAERKAKTEDGRLLQLPLYAAALSIDQGMPVVGGAYVHLHERVIKVDHAIEAVGELIGAAEVPFDPEAARRKAIELAGRIRDGDFALTPHTHGQPHSECTSFCPLRHACRSPEGYKTISL